MIESANGYAEPAPLLPKQMRYQAALCSEPSNVIDGIGNLPPAGKSVENLSATQVTVDAPCGTESPVKVPHDVPQPFGPPIVENATGISWERVKGKWLGSWRARQDLCRLGNLPRSIRLWHSNERPTPRDMAYIAERCRAYQASMEAWWEERRPPPAKFDGRTLGSLIECYRTDRVSPYHKTRHATRQTYDKLCHRLKLDCASTEIASIKYRLTQEWYDGWTASGVTMAHSLVRMLRTVVSFGATLLEDAECARVCSVLRASKFKNAKPRDKWLTAEQAVAVRKMAHKMGFPSIALAQAFQFEGMLRQKDVIGEWIPITEPGESDVIDGNDKWMCGIRWSEVDAEMTLTHVTSKRQKVVTKDLKLAAMVVEELKMIGALPDTGPIIVCEHTGRPWRAADFRRQWRIIATAAKVPKDVRNMDTRAGAITEALLAGAPLDSVRKAATHSDPQMTARYSRNDAEADADVSRKRAASRAA